ncbi:MAG: methyltransferase domain-containing protein [Methanospirillum sp.]|uniref:class I SAM-dependent methyltransferase n=1 Tax=Methanospirillum sp. TaxID=45200 RepID=UPI0023744167|nr:class I SAM-dependent methyltransferase [Methanospirillum sp.]MDD1729615.1 methyltransferase domain-containing protein [Methanospirillum sp.]
MKTPYSSHEPEGRIKLNAYLPVPLHGWALKHQISTYWDQVALDYAKHQWDQAIAIPADTVLEWKNLLSKSLGTKTCTVLDAGCGPGTLTCLLSKMGCLVTGVDLSFPMIKAAREYANTSHASIRLKRGDLEFIPFPENSFDAVVSRDVLCATVHPDRIVHEWMRVLRPGGRLILIDRNWNCSDRSIPGRICRFVAPGIIDRILDNYSPVPDMPPHMRNALWSHSRSRPLYDLNLIQKAGFVDVEVEPRLPKTRFETRESLLGYASRRFLISARKP